MSIARFDAPARRLVAATPIACAFALAAAPLSAEVTVNVRGQEVRIEAKEAAVDEILSALSAQTSLRYRSPEMLDRRISGTYEGPVASVLTNMLRNDNFVLTTSADGTIDVLIVAPAEPGSPPQVARRATATKTAPVPETASPAAPPQDDRPRSFGANAPRVKVAGKFNRPHVARLLRGNNPKKPDPALP